MTVSRASLSESNTNEHDLTTNSKIYKIIRDMANADGENFVSEWPLRIIRERVFAKGFTETQLDDCVREYEDLGVWTVISNGTRLSFIVEGDMMSDDGQGEEHNNDD